MPCAILPPSQFRRMASGGYAGFGSFHSDNVEDMVRDRSFRPPPSPVEELGLSGARDVPFGHAFGRRYFHLDPSWTFLNHGAFGACLKHALHAAARWREHAEHQPLRFLDRELFPHLVGVVREFAPLIGAVPERVALIQNATAGLNAVVRSADLGPGDSLFMLDIGYGSVKKMCAAAVSEAAEKMRATAEALGASEALTEDRLPRFIEAHVPLDDSISADRIVQVVSDSLPADGSCRLAVFDHITSNTALRLPIERLVALCHHRNVPVLIDGAHGLVCDGLFLDTLGADYYCGNLHKWLCAPKGSGFIYVKDPTAPHRPPKPAPPAYARQHSPAHLRRSPGSPAPAAPPTPRTPRSLSPSFVIAAPSSPSAATAQRRKRATSALLGEAGGPRAPLPRPAVLSHGANAGFLSSFIWDGHRDYSPQLASAVAVRFWGEVGLQRARDRMRSLAREAAWLLCDRWATRRFTQDAALTACPMACVELPLYGQAAADRTLPVDAPGRAVGREDARRLPFALPVAPGDALDSSHAKAVQDALHFGYQVEVPVKCLAGRLYVRISAHVYNEIGDYEALAAAVLDLVARAARR